MVTKLTSRIATALAQSRVAKLTERLTVRVNVVDDIDTYQMVTQVESANACPIHKGKVAKGNLDR